MQTTSPVRRVCWLHHESQPAPWVRFMRSLAFRLQRQRQRAALGRLEDRLLSDIGLSRQVVEQEAVKPIWRD